MYLYLYEHIFVRKLFNVYFRSFGLGLVYVKNGSLNHLSVRFYHRTGDLNHSVIVPSWFREICDSQCVRTGFYCTQSPSQSPSSCLAHAAGRPIVGVPTGSARDGGNSAMGQSFFGGLIWRIFSIPIFFKRLFRGNPQY